MEIKLEAEIIIKCTECGSVLEEHTFDSRAEILTVYPCSKCMKQKDDEIESLKEELKEQKQND